jgi:hypothetical protein
MPEPSAKPKFYAAQNATYVDVPFEVGPSGLKIDAILDWNMSELPAGGVALPDLDFLCSTRTAKK